MCRKAFSLFLYYHEAIILIIEAQWQSCQWEQQQKKREREGDRTGLEESWWVSDQKDTELTLCDRILREILSWAPENGATMDWWPECIQGQQPDNIPALASVTRSVGASSCTRKGGGFLSHICVSVCPSLSPSHINVSLSWPLSLKAMKRYPQVRRKKECCLGISHDTHPSGLR